MSKLLKKNPESKAEIVEKEFKKSKSNEKENNKKGKQNSFK